MFVHLKTKTIYSLLEGAIFAKALADLCCEFKMPAVGIADRANLFGALEFSEILSENGIQPVIGCQLPVSATEINLKKLSAENIYHFEVIFLMRKFKQEERTDTLTLHVTTPAHRSGSTGKR